MTAALDAQDAVDWMSMARQGDLEGAWRITDRIRARRGPERDWTIPRHYQQIWDGTPLDGRRVLIRCYHGLGDTIQFVRYVPLVRSIAREVSVWVQPALLPLLTGMPGIDRLLQLHDGSPEVEYDVDIESMELPYAFRTTVETIPQSQHYLWVKAATFSGPPPKVGVVWRGGDWNQQRSPPFDDLRPLFDNDHVSWFGLQFDPQPHEVHPRLRRVDTSGVTRLASAIRAMDLVITVDSLPAHLAGALGVPVWTLLPQQSDWRWMEDRTDSPWYPTMRLFRQTRGGWRSVVDDVQRALMARVADTR